jgi:hypothetical protein
MKEEEEEEEEEAILRGWNLWALLVYTPVS